MALDFLCRLWCVLFSPQYFSYLWNGPTNFICQCIDWSGYLFYRVFSLSTTIPFPVSPSYILDYSCVLLFWYPFLCGYNFSMYGKVPFFPSSTAAFPLSPFLLSLLLPCCCVRIVYYWLTGLALWLILLSVLLTNRLGWLIFESSTHGCCFSVSFAQYPL